MATEADVQYTTPVSEVSDSSGLRDGRCSSPPVRKWQLNAAIFRRISLSDVLEYVIVLALLAGWLAITWSRVSLFLSEPTATKIYWEEEFTPAAFSICPRTKVNLEMFSYSYGYASTFGTDGFKIYPGSSNESLEQFIQYSGLQGRIIIGLYWKTHSSNRLLDASKWKHGESKVILNYAFGGTCSTVMPTQSTKMAFLTLRRHINFEIPEYKEHKYNNSYELHLHGSPEFWGAPLPGMETYLIRSDTTETEVFVTVDREVRPNLRRAPCESDPSYSLAACQRRCFFDWLHCRMEESAEDDGRPLCTVADANPYEVFMGLGVFDKFLDDGTDGVKPIDRCRCPDPCVSHRYGFQIRPTTYSSPDELLTLQVRFEDVQRVLVTYETYTFPDLLADMGGHMGLLLGWSLLSLYGATHELVLACKRMLCGMRRKTSAMET